MLPVCAFLFFGLPYTTHLYRTSDIILVMGIRACNLYLAVSLYEGGWGLLRNDARPPIVIKIEQHETRNLLYLPNPGDMNGHTNH